MRPMFLAPIVASAALALHREATAQSSCAPIERALLGLEVVNPLGGPVFPGLVIDIAEWPNTGQIFVCGYFDHAHGNPVGTASQINVARLSTATGQFRSSTTIPQPGTTGGQTSGPWGLGVTSLIYWPTINAMVAGGSFTSIDGSAASDLAFLTYNAASWLPLAVGGVDGPDGHVNDLSVDSANNLVVAGRFTSVNGTAANCIARTNGFNWLPIGSGPSSLSALYNAEITCVHALSPNDVVVAGFGFTTVGGSSTYSPFVEAWDGSTWTVLATVGAIDVMKTRSGDVYISGGDYSTITGQSSSMAKWNGIGWTAVGECTQGVCTPIYMDELVTGDVIATVGSDVNGIPCNGIARYNALVDSPEWDPFSPLVTSVGPGAFAVKVSGVDRDTLYVGTYGGLIELTPSCKAVSASIGSSCLLGFALTGTLSASRPWAGTRFVSNLFKLPLPTSPAFMFLGDTQSAPTPLAITYPAPAGCMVHIDTNSPLFVYFPMAAGTVVQFPLDIPATLGIVGLTFYQQAVVFGPTEAYTTSALRFTIGGFGL